jgi:conjugative transfer region protein TrbK
VTRADATPLIRFGALAFAVIAIVLAAVQLDREEDRDGSVMKVVGVAPDESAADPLAAELARCRALTDPETIDEACRHAWAERRARFFGKAEKARP